MSVSYACDDEDLVDSPEQSEVRQAVLDFEDLFELCMMGQITAEQQKELDDLYAYLIAQEYSRWEGSDGEVVEMIIEHSNLDFPMLRYELGLLPTTI